MPGIARRLDPVLCEADLHPLPPLPPMVVTVQGQFTGGSPNTFVNNRAAVRVGDPGVHTACCGPNTFVAASGAPKTFVNNQPLVREGDLTSHCLGSPGRVLAGMGSPNTFA